MASLTPAHPEVALNLALAVVASSTAPVLLLDGDLKVVAASHSFCTVFHTDPEMVRGREVFALGDGEWDFPRLRSLLSATVRGQVKIDAYEMDLHRRDQPSRRLVLHAQILGYGDPAHVRLMLTVSDVTDTRASEKLKDDLLREKAILLQEVQHRVANSLQIIASVLLQNARNVRSEETRTHLKDAHSRVMSIAAVQQQLAVSRLSDVELRPYFKQLCQSLAASMIRDDQVSLEVTADDSSVSGDSSVSLGLVVTELVINALKHAFPGGRHGKILVGYNSQGANWKLSVADNGVGMPPNVDDAKPGLGSSIVEALARQMDAKVEVADAHPGTAISLMHAQALPASSSGIATVQSAI